MYILNICFRYYEMKKSSRVVWLVRLIIPIGTAALFRRYKMNPCTRLLFVCDSIVSSRVVHELIETEPQGSNGVIFLGHSQNLFKFAIQHICWRKQFFKPLWTIPILIEELTVWPRRLTEVISRESRSLSLSKKLDSSSSCDIDDQLEGASCQLHVWHLQTPWRQFQCHVLLQYKCRENHWGK